MKNNQFTTYRRLSLGVFHFPSKRAMNHIVMLSCTPLYRNPQTILKLLFAASKLVI